MGKLRVGIVGIKRSGMCVHRAKNVLTNPDCELAGLCCRTQEVVQEMCSELGGRPFTDYDEMAASPEIDAICVSIRNRLHYPMAKKALENGKHVLVEYPVVTRLEEFDELVDLAAQKALVIHHGLNVRHETLYKWFEDALKRIGDPISITGYAFLGGGWYKDLNESGDMFATLHLHFIDYYIGLFGYPLWLNAFAKRLTVGGEEQGYGSVMMGHPGNVVSYLEFGNSLPHGLRYEVRLVGTDGYLMGDKQRAAGKFGSEEMRFDAPADFDALQPDTDDFVDQVVHGAAPLYPLEEMRKTLHVALLCMKSAQENRRIDFRQ